MRVFVIIITTLAALCGAGRSYALDDCECQVNGEYKYSGSSDAQCSLLYHIANQSSGDCNMITFESGMNGTIKLGSGFPLNANYLRVVGPVDSNGNPKITLVPNNISTEYFIRLMGEHTNGLPTLENFYIQAPGKKAIYIDGSGHVLKNVRISESNIGVEIVGSKNKITASGNKFYNNDSVGVKVNTGDYNYISQALFYGNGKNAIERVSGGNSSTSFRGAKKMSVVGLENADVKTLVGITGLADKDLDKGLDGVEFFEADTATLDQALGQGKKYVAKKNASSWAFGLVDEKDANLKRFGVVVANLAEDKYYTVSSIADKTDSDETSEFSNPFGAENEMIIGGQDCLDPAKDNAWYLFAIDGYDNEGDDAVCYKKNEDEMVGISCTGDPWTVDSDNDGMPNGLEDKDFDCFVDSGETDPDVPNDECVLFPNLSTCAPIGGKVNNPDINLVCIGDICEETPTDSDDNDWDDDGILNDKDNCPYTPNPKQEDVDGDKVGDVCDNCKYKKNADQEDSDGDGIGALCEGDRDSDGIIDDIDNCIDTPNFDQVNIDGDIYGDVCDNCADDENGDQKDSDSDGAGDICDNCIAAPNPGQDDLDSDAMGDVCDTDMDGDGIPDIGDNCPSVYNKDQADSDADGIGDRCDLDPSISPDLAEEPVPAFFADIEGGGGHVSSRGGCSGDIGLIADSGAPNLLATIALLGAPISAIFIRRRFHSF